MLIQIEKMIILFENQQSNIYFCLIKRLFRDFQNCKKQLQLTFAKSNI